MELARIEPTRGYFSNAELDHYKRMLECCHKHNIAPAVTFIHGSAPRWFAEAGGWVNPDSPAMFACYCAHVAKVLGGEIMYAFTINEPQVARSFRSLPGAALSFKKRDQIGYAEHEAAAKATNGPSFITCDYPDTEKMTP